MIADVKDSDDSIKYLAEDTELHRPVAIRVQPQSSAEQIERAQRRKLTLALGAGVFGLLLALVFALFPPFSFSPVAEGPVRRFTLPTDGVPSRFNRKPMALNSPRHKRCHGRRHSGCRTWRLSGVRRR